MTIAVKIENQESTDDFSKELLVELLRADGSVHQNFTLKGGASTVAHVHPVQSIRLSERFVDRLNPADLPNMGRR